MTTSSDPSTRPSEPWPLRKYTPRHTTWPYTPEDFARYDESQDTSFYSRPRFVTHIDDAAITRLREYYARVLPRTGRILDLCSSWVSHFPDDLEAAAKTGDLEVVGIGMNQKELDANRVLPSSSSRILADLNATPDVGCAVGDQKFDAVTCVVSIDYLKKPLYVLSSLRKCLKNDGDRVHLVISNRCFPSKAVARWLGINEEERLQMVGDYLHFSGWKDIEIVELQGYGRSDPLWVVRGARGETQTSTQI